VLLHEGLYDREFLEEWVNWREYLAWAHPGEPRVVRAFIESLKARYAYATPDKPRPSAASRRRRSVEVARAIGAAKSAFASHVWRNAASGNEGGWQVARCLQFVACSSAPSAPRAAPT
jgi:anaerobic selenocysteine-containing dehydrogenase